MNKEWKPHRKQAAFYAIPDSIKEAMYGGGAGSAKTETLLMFGVVRKFVFNPRFKQLLLRRTFPELKREVLPRSEELFRPFRAKLNRADMVWRFPREDQYGSDMGNDGGLIFLGHCENESDVHKYDSMEVSLFTPDEITSFTENMYMYIAFTRVRTPAGSNLPALVRPAGMPGDIGHTWVKNRFIAPAPTGNKIIIGRGGLKRIYIHATAADNPYCDPTYLQSLEALPEAEKQAKKYGSWDAYLGQVFEEFRDVKYPDEPDNALHVIQPFGIPDYWTKIVVGDWGFRANTWIGFGAISPQRQLFIYRELHWRGRKISDWAPEVKYWIDKERPKLIRFCKSAGQDRGQEHTIQEQLESILGPIELTQNTAGSRIAGKMLLHEYLRWNQPPSIEKLITSYDHNHALWLMRNRGLESYNKYLDQYNHVEPEVLPKLQIFNTCTMLIDAIKACTYAKPRDGKPAEDVAEFDGDDAYDGIRYLVDAASSYVQDSIDEMNKVQAQSIIEQDFQQTQDYNRLFRMAKVMERQSFGPSAIKRYHH